MASKTNFLQETLDVMKHQFQSPETIKWIGSCCDPYGCTWKEFTKLADFTYDCNTSKFIIPHDFVIVFKDQSWIERVHDGKWEHWTYHKTPDKKGAGQTYKIKTLQGRDQTLEELNAIQEKKKGTK